MSQWLKKNAVITINGASAMVQCLDLAIDSVVLFNLTTQQTSSMSIKELRYQLAIGEACMNTPQASRGLLRDFETNSLASARFKVNEAIVGVLKKSIARGMTPRAAIMAAREGPIVLATGETVMMCSIRQAYRLLKHSEDPRIALMPAYSLRGNRVPRCARMNEIILQVIDDEYNREKSRISLGSVRTIAQEKAKAEGIPEKDRRVSLKRVNSVMKKNWDPDREYNRLDQRVAKSLKAVAKERIKPGSPLNRVEIDAVCLPFILRGDGDGEFIEKVWLLHAIDCETSMPLGWRLLTVAPTTEDTFSCLEMSIYPKAELLRNMGIKFSVDPFGLIKNLILDNGPENSRVRLAGLTKVDINLQWTPVNSGHLKPFIERHNGSIKRALEMLPGCTRFNGKDGMRTEQAKVDANLLTKEELNHWIGRWKYEVWAHTPLDRFITAEYENDKYLGATPAERWINFEKSVCLPGCPTPKAWRTVRFIAAIGTLSHKTGIQHGTFEFKGKNLQILCDQYGRESLVEYHYNPHDFRIIYVPDKESGEWVELQNAEVGTTTPAYSFEEAKERRADKKAAHTPSPTIEQFTSDIVARSVGTQTKKQKRDAQRQAHNRQERERQAQARADENPMQEPSPVDPSYDTYVAEDAIEKLVKHKKTDRTTK